MNGGNQANEASQRQQRISHESSGIFPLRASSGEVATRGDGVVGFTFFPSFHFPAPQLGD